jgi:catechol 2,3-dioxygenase-like lactoylglutathione lyase family enzyme
MKIKNIDHLVLTVRDISQTLSFYTNVLGMEKQSFGDGRMALLFGEQKINLHEYGKEFEPKAHLAVPGSEDLCFVTDTPLADAMQHVRDQGVDIIEGPVKRTGANGPIESFYFRDPDLNLIEVSNY